MKKYFCIIFSVATVMVGSCQGERNASGKVYESNAFKEYWYAGKAEINSYRLSQSRYGERREGSAVLIFVTEDFSKQKQVKLDEPSKAKSDKVNVLKLNFTKNFITGIYPYSMMKSVFTPVVRHEYPNSLKVTMSSQEWCGHVFTQLNLRGKEYELKSYSYFEQEGDVTTNMTKLLLEDEIWNIIRLDHQSLPVGDIEVIPGLFFTRLNHVDLKPQHAVASRSEADDLITYTLDIPTLQRKLAIEYEKTFPYKIVRWHEEFQERGKKQHTSAVLDRTLVTDYWTKNKNEFQYLRDSLNLPIPR
jgi:hypothetical protein